MSVKTELQGTSMMVYLYPTAVDELDHSSIPRSRSVLAQRIDLELPAKSKVARQTRKLSSEKMSWLLAFIEANLSSELSVSVLAGQVGLSPDRLARVFKAKIGITPHQYILGKRLELAARMLAQTESPIGDVGAATGFSDAATFGRAFKKRFSVSPGIYRKGPIGQ